MSTIDLNQWQQLEYHDPEFVLKRLREIEFKYQDYEIDPKIRNLRTNRLRPHREGRQAALFCYGMGILKGRKVWFAPFEASDYDFIALCEDKGTACYVPIQLKELVPESANPNAELNELIGNLRKYNSPQLTVAIYLNRTTRIKFEKLECENLNLAEIWLFGSNTPDQTSWLLYGDLLTNPIPTEFVYPEP
ncbi:hypothetical protein [Nitrospina watsonii]|uniref:Integron gene cassette protein n=1 Tax=Nitrospina watsonii TaxID=1323948 RepID=A0ABN8VZN9_9BACT|nr:hypothetical protein [Nitrospina watsonii]CAI2717399.1 Putative integron gene cassette protein [Nitrospina watsonii]